MVTPGIRKSIREVVDQVVELAHPRRVILFGSAATGRLAQDSDLDFLVVVADGDSTDELVDRLNTQVRRRPHPCDFVVVTEDVLSRNRDNPGLIYGEILSRGQEVYAV